MFLKNKYRSTDQVRSSDHWMQEALREAARGAKRGEIPVGAVVVHHNKIVARAHNRSEEKNSFLEHAEHIALQKAVKKLGRWKIQEAELYVTLEPCAMCAGAILLSRIKKVSYGTRDPKAGADGSAVHVLRDKKLNHRVHIEEGVCAAECGAILSVFFAKLRTHLKAAKGKRLS